MGRKCCVPKCRSGYSLPKSNTNDEKQSISVFSFLENQKLKRKWMRAIPRDNWEPTSGVCKQHFKPDDLALERTDTNERRKKKKEPLALIRLKSDAIPTIFPNCPAYLSNEIPNRSSGGATENRLENYEQRVKEKNNILDEADKVESINDLLLKLDRSLLPAVVLENKTENILIFFTISFEIKPTFSSFVCLKEDLSFTAWRGDVKIPFTKFSHITRSHNIHRCSQLVEIINISVQESNNPKQDSTDVIAYCADKFNSAVKDIEDDMQFKAAFLVEQLCLLSKSSHNRRYSPDLIASATSWLLNSPSLDNQLRSEVLTCPVPHYIKRLTNAINVDLGLSKATEIYLKTRFDRLPNERDKIVSVILDEVYAASNVEFVGGNFSVVKMELQQKHYCAQ